MDFRRWALDERGLSESSTSKYYSALEGPLSRWAIESGASDTPLLEVNDTAQLEQIASKIRSFDDFKEADGNGNGMYGAALNRFLDFLISKQEDLHSKPIWSLGEKYKDTASKSNPSDQLLRLLVKSDEKTIGNSSGIRPLCAVDDPEARDGYAAIIIISSDIRNRASGQWVSFIPDYQNGDYLYWGDSQNKPNSCAMDWRGNQALAKAYEAAQAGKHTPLILFSKPSTGVIQFRGLGFLKSVQTKTQHQYGGVPVENLLASIEILDCMEVSPEWITGRANNSFEENENSPTAWEQALSDEIVKISLSLEQIRELELPLPPDTAVEAFDFLSPDDIVEALDIFDSGENAGFGPSTTYDLVFHERRYPPKAIIGIACKRTLGRFATHDEFSGGLNQPAFRALNRLGFEIVSKPINLSPWRNQMEGWSFSANQEKFNSFCQKVDPDWNTQQEKHVWLETGFLCFRNKTSAFHFHIPEVEIVPFLARWLKENQAIGKAIEDHNDFSQKSLWQYMEKPYRHVYSKTSLFDGVGINDIPREVASQTKGLMYALSKYVGFVTADTNCRYDEELLLDEQHLTAFFDVIAEGNEPAEVGLVIEELITSYQKYLDTKYVFNAGDVRRFVSSLVTKPFVILTGPSGTGKTKIAQEFAIWLSGAGDKNYELVPVGADWTDNRSVFGFLNLLRENIDGHPGVFQATPVLDLIKKAERNPNEPHLLILDEMNLSHVERYFSDFLSVMESGEPIPLHSEKESVYSSSGYKLENSIRLPENLYVVGTVNVDETTYMFSPKVLDRANVIEIRADSGAIEKYLNSTSLNDDVITQSVASNALKAFQRLSSQARGIKYAGVTQSPLSIPENFEKADRSLVELFGLLSSRGFDFGFRSIMEIKRYILVDYALTGDKQDWDISEVLDIQVLQKLLPKLHGSRRKIEAVLVALASYCQTGKMEQANKYLEPNGNLQDLTLVEDSNAIKLPLSYKKLWSMIRDVRRDQFVSFIQ